LAEIQPEAIGCRINCGELKRKEKPGKGEKKIKRTERKKMRRGKGGAASDACGQRSAGSMAAFYPVNGKTGRKETIQAVFASTPASSKTISLCHWRTCIRWVSA